MSFFKTSRVEILGYKDDFNQSLKRTASAHRIASALSTPSVEKISEELLKVCDHYKISENPKDYVFVAVRALTADVPNENYDCFTEEELLRYDERQGCKVFETFILKPHHVEHRSDDMTQARGVILDACYNDKNAEHFPELLIAVDKTKDKELAEGIASGELTGFSMGCTAQNTTCSICGNKAEAPQEFCSHIRFDKGKELEGKLAFEYCGGVVFEEESSVGNPADKKAVTQEVIAKRDDSFIEDMTSKIEELTAKVFELSNKTSEIDKDITMEVIDDENIDTKNKKTIEQYTKEKEKEKNKSLSKEELGLENAEDTAACNKKKKKSVAPSKTEATGNNKIYEKKEIYMKKAKNLRNRKTKAKKVASKKVASVKKKALDPAAKKYLEKFYSDYGKGLTKDVKRKTLGKALPKNDPKIKGLKPSKTKVKSKKATYKFANLYRDLKVFDCSHGWALVAKNDSPLYLVKAEKTNKDLLRSIATSGLVKTMKEHKAVKLTSMFTTGYEPSVTSGVENDLRDKSSTTKKVKGKDGIEANGIGDKRGEGYKPNTDKPVFDMKVKGSAKSLARFVSKYVKTKTANKDMEKIAKKFVAGIDSGVALDMRKSKDYLPKGNTAMTDGDSNDLADARAKNTKENIYSGGADDCRDTRGNIIKIKTSSRKRKSSKGSMTRLEAEKLASTIAADIIAEELPKSEDLFKRKFVRAMYLAAKRASVNLTDNPLKLALSDTLINEQDYYSGMDPELAIALVEEGYEKGADDLIASILDEAEGFLDLPDEAFLALEKDANKINVVASSIVGSYIPKNEEDNHSEELMRKASESNPVFLNREQENTGGQFDALKGQLFNRG